MGFKEYALIPEALQLLLHLFWFCLTLYRTKPIDGNFSVPTINIIRAIFCTQLLEWETGAVMNNGQLEKKLPPHEHTVFPYKAIVAEESACICYFFLLN